MSQIKIRDRIVGLKRVRASELLADPLNYRKHPEKQREAFRALANSIGFAGAAIARELPNGKLMLIDGHLRKEELEAMGNQKVPVLVLDVNEEEAAIILASYDRLGSLAETDKGTLSKLLRKIEPGDEILVGFFSELAKEAGAASAEDLELDTEGLPEGGEDSNPGELPEASHVRMVQLFMNTTTLPPFQDKLEYLGEKYGTQSTTDTVMKTVEVLYKLERKKEREAK